MWRGRCRLARVVGRELKITPKKKNNKIALEFLDSPEWRLYVTVITK